MTTPKTSLRRSSSHRCLWNSTKLSKHKKANLLPKGLNLQDVLDLEEEEEDQEPESTRLKSTIDSMKSCREL